jgi:hypothetical protein
MCNDSRSPRFPGDYVSGRGIHYKITNESGGTHGLWMWSNHASGWGWKGSFPTKEAAIENMKSGDSTLEGV